MCLHVLLKMLLQSSSPDIQWQEKLEATDLGQFQPFLMAPNCFSPDRDWLQPPPYSRDSTSEEYSIMTRPERYTTPRVALIQPVAYGEAEMVIYA
ncbi:hypothetical protein AOLI_G00258060 [Acnodon oligacanthus]